MIQRQPRPAPESPPEKKKSLKESGIGVNDPIFDKTAQIIDEVLQRNQRLAPYIGDKLKSGFRIAAKGKFVQELSNGNFDDAYREAYDLDKSDSIPSTILGFYDHKKLEVHLRPDAKFGTALHESVHKLASSQLYAHLSIAKKVSENLVTVLTEGVTAFFTDHILIDEGLTKHIDAYHNSKKKAAELVKALGSNGFDLIARFNFKFAIVDMGNALGLSPKQYGDLKAGAPEEVFKRINNLLKSI